MCGFSFLKAIDADRNRRNKKLKLFIFADTGFYVPGEKRDNAFLEKTFPCGK